MKIAVKMLKNSQMEIGFKVKVRAITHMDQII